MIKHIELIGIPYETIGRCWGLCREVYRINGRPPLPDYQGSVEDTPDLMESKLPEFTALPGPEPLALVAFRMIGFYVNHVGVVLNDKKSFIHAFKGRNVAVERLDHILWKSRIAGFYKWNP